MFFNRAWDGSYEFRALGCNSGCRVSGLGLKASALAFRVGDSLRTVLLDMMWSLQSSVEACGYQNVL